MSMFNNRRRIIPASVLTQCDPGVGVDYLFAEAKTNTPFAGCETALAKFDAPIEEIEFGSSYEVIDVSKSDSSSETVDASASFGIGSFKGSASFNLLSEATSDSRTFHLLVHVWVKTGGSRLSAIAQNALEFSNVANRYLPQPSDTDYDNFDYSKFYSFYGDSFVSGKLTGGEFYFLASVTCKNETHKEEIKGQVKVSGLWAEGDVSTSVSKWSKSDGVSVKVDYRVSGTLHAPDCLPQSTDPRDLLSIINYANNFSNLFKDGTGNDLYYELTGYEELAQLGDRFRPRTEQQKTALKALSERYDVYNRIQKKLKNIQRTPFAYDLSGSRKSIAELGSIVSAAMDSVNKAANSIQGTNNEKWLNEVPAKVNGQELPDPKLLVEQLPKPLFWHFIVAPMINLNNTKPVAEIQYTSWNGSLWSACILYNKFRHTPLDAAGNPAGPSHESDDIRYLNFNYEKGEQRKMRAALLPALDQVKGLFTHYEHIDEDHRTWIGETNQIFYLDVNGVWQYSECRLTAA